MSVTQPPTTFTCVRVALIWCFVLFIFDSSVRGKPRHVTLYTYQNDPTNGACTRGTLHHSSSRALKNALFIVC